MNSAKLLLNYQLAQTILCSHAVFNFLTTIQNQVTFDEKRDALNALSNYAQFVRKVNGLIAKEFNSFEQELQLLENYLNMEKARLNGELGFNFNVSETVKSYAIPVFILVPFVEILLTAALKSGSKDAVMIDMDFRLNDNKFMTTLDFNHPIEELSQYQWNPEQSLRLKLVQEKIAQSGFEIERVTNQKNKTTQFILKN